MTASAPPKYERLLESVTTALEEGSVAAARRHLMWARAKVGDDVELRGAITALELVCDVDDGDEERCKARLAELEARTTSEPIPFANAIGCTLSDVGERLRDTLFLELAETWLGRRASEHSDAILFANHALVLERLERFEDAIPLLERALELDPDEHRYRLRLAQAASDAGDLERAAEAYRAYLQAHPDDAHEWISLAIVLCNMGRVPEAEQAYWRAAGLDPANVSLHFNWLISAHRVGDRERARDAQKKLEAIAPHDWRTRMASVFELDVAGDAAGAFRLGRQLFGDLIAEDSEERPLHYVAGQVSDIVMRSREQLRSEAAAFVDQLFEAEVFTPYTLELIRALEQPLATGLSMYELLVEALYREHGAPFACFVNYGVLARDADEAIAFARRFEERCGASETRVRKADVEELERRTTADHAGVCWRSGRNAFPADEFGTTD